MHERIPNRPPRGLAGVNTALVTPMHADGSLDLEGLDAHIDRQIEAKVASVTALGTTGEAATLSEQEKRLVIQRVVRRVDGRVPILVGTGAQGPAATIEAQRVAAGEGASFGLVVTPYYNKPPQEGLIRHFEAVADQSELPLVLYNVPSRTSCDMLPATMVALACHPRIVGVKEATGQLGRLDALVGQVPSDFALLSGDDAITCAFCLMGGHGVISVTSNIVPELMVAMVRAACAAQVEEARSVHRRLLRLIDALFVAPNPMPIKAVLHQAGLMGAGIRLPLTAVASEITLVLKHALSETAS